LLCLVPSILKTLKIDKFCLCTKLYEILTIRVTVNKTPIVLAVVYRPPVYVPIESRELEEFTSVLTSIASTHPNCYIIGDFNLPGIDWNTCVGNTPVEKRLADWYKFSSLYQIVCSPTRGSKLLDVVFCSSKSSVSQISVHEPFGDDSIQSDHSSIIVKTSFPVKPAKSIIKFRNFNKAPWGQMENFLLCFDWITAFAHCRNCIEKWNVFVDLSNWLISNFVPESRISTRSGLIPNWTPGLQTLKSVHARVSKRYSIAKTNGTRTINDYYAKLFTGRLLLHNRRKTRRTHEAKMLNQPSPRKYWKFVGSRMKTRTTLPNLIDTDGTILTEDQDKADALSKQFASALIVDNGNLSTPQPKYALLLSNLAKFNSTLIFYLVFVLMNCFRTTGLVNKIFSRRNKPAFVVNEWDVMQLLKKLKNSRSSGPDGLPNIFLKKLSIPLAPILVSIFNMSLCTSLVPPGWKKAIVTAVPKDGRNPSVGKYRPISLTSTSCKVFEKILTAKILEHFSSRNLLNSCQFGFRGAKSVESQLLCCLNDWTKNYDDGYPTDVFYLDLAKAFDKVPHLKLIDKLKYYGLHPSLIEWIKEYLTGRSHYVRVNSACSSNVHLTSGVPQGSVLGPLLFLIFINDLPKVVKYAKLYLFADDLKIYMKVRNIDDAARLQEDINAILRWCSLNQLEISIEKCSILHIHSSPNPNSFYVYTMDMSIVKSVTEVRDLGVIIDSKLNFKSHISQIIKRASRAKAMLYHCFFTRDYILKTKLYKCYVRSLLEFSPAVWSPSAVGLTNDIEKVQKSFLRSMQAINDQTPILPSLETRRMINDLVVAFKIIKGVIPGIRRGDFFELAPVDTTQYTRGHSLKLSKPHVRTDIRKNFFGIRLINAWNALPSEIVMLTNVNKFRNELKNIYYV
jgi:hypothetical protein